MQVMGVFQENLVYQTEKPGNFLSRKIWWSKRQSQPDIMCSGALFSNKNNKKFAH